MIERLDDVLVQSVATTNCITHKINELVDAVNEQQQQLNNHMCRLVALEHTEEPAEELVVPCEEHIEWIGKLCKFWDFAEFPVYGILDDANIGNSGYPYKIKNGTFYQNCEPVSPEDDIIYKKD
jgi:hypothetical protein